MERIKTVVKEVLPYILIIILVILIKAFIFTPVIVNGSSMESTLYNKDIMILDKIGMRMNGIKRFDIVVIQTKNTKIIKRVIGLPGESIECKGGNIYINGKKIEDDYGSNPTKDFELVDIPKDTYFVLGDNRGNSLDSRILGPISKEDILGYATFTLFPFTRFGKK